ncbi:MAG: ATP-binding protein [Ruminiclostridium sp.]|uniref:ATP-binding protein n=1 Tax=Ruminococcus sp. TaxID=41978 RepID=UPI0025E7C1EC|nr:ATP-binding protein [Ruminococcus sp.]MBR1432551.1 ATP-binding protein [Ruminococcus sp.]MBR1832637.1 ATP-binding protein [Ruminiclostridium sp.]
MKQKAYFPFTAIVGQEKMKRALILNLINPALGGVLIKGEKGTAKSTAVRALTQVMPERREVRDCQFSCDPDDKSCQCDDCREKEEHEIVMRRMRVVDLPVSATEDRVVGTLDIEKALTTGEKHFEPGILAEANRNILYIDEINLLDDHVVDVILDSAAMGVNNVEREGVSFSHPARFVLVGTMNPEEGDLRPQLLDRFGLVADIRGETDIEMRTEVVKRCLEYESDPDKFLEKWQPEQDKLCRRISKAHELLGKVTCSDDILRLAAEISVSLGVDGHRADIAMIKTAMTNAAYEGRISVVNDDMKLAAELVLPHRMRRKPFEEQRLDIDSVFEMIESRDVT